MRVYYLVVYVYVMRMAVRIAVCIDVRVTVPTFIIVKVENIKSKEKSCERKDMNDLIPTNIEIPGIIIYIYIYILHCYCYCYFYLV